MKNRLSQYHLIERSDFNEFQAAVNALLASGAELVGGVSVAVYYDPTSYNGGQAYFTYYQAMTVLK